MRIALNLIGFAPGCGGVETYVTRLLAALQRVDRENEYLVLGDEIAASILKVNAPNFKLKLYPYQKHSLQWYARAAMQRIFGFDTLAHELKKLPVDVMHHPLTVLNPPGLPYPSVLTFHDMQQEYFPEFFTPLELHRRKRSYLPSVLEAGAVITVSEHGRGCLIERYGIDPGKVHAVHSGCGEEFHPRDAAALSETAAKYGILGPFILYPAATWPHKNHLRLLEAVRILVEREGFQGSLVLSGAQQEGHRDFLVADRVKWLGYLPEGELSYLYNLAQVMAFPSLFEGFGLPVVESMASGCPVVCARSSSLPEVGGDAAVYFDPLDAHDIAAAIWRVWNDDALCSEMRLRGVAQASGFTWEETARKTIRIYRQATSPR